MDTPVLARDLWAISASFLTADLCPACHGDAPRAAGLDGQSANWVPIACHELEARCAERVCPVPARPISPSRPVHPLSHGGADERMGLSGEQVTRHSGAPWTPPSRSIAHMTRAVLLATATTATFAGLRVRSFAS